MLKRHKVKRGITLIILLLVLCSQITFAADDAGFYFDRQQGTMIWSPKNAENENQFMSFLNMVPGGTYQSKMTIENRSSKTYTLYMQVIPLEQEIMQDELLDQISMNVYYDNNLLYRGTAMGANYGGSSTDLRNVILLGKYIPGKMAGIKVDLQLSKDLDMKYMDLLTEIDWKFMVTEEKNPDETIPLKSPQTGDGVQIWQWVVLVLLSIIFVTVILRKKKTKMP